MTGLGRLGWLSRGLAIVGAVGILGGVCAGAWLALGGFDVAASSPHSRLSYWAIHAVMLRTVDARAAAVAPPPLFTPDRVVAGFRQYDAECVRCHGAPGVARETWADWMNPSPPYLMDASKHLSEREMFWLVCHGAKMTGMPAWGSHRSDDDIWNLVAFLHAMPRLAAADYAKLRQSYPGSEPSGAPGTPDARCLMQP